MTPNPSKLLTESEAAEMLAIKVRTLQTWRYQRRVLPFVKIGDCVRYKIADVEKFLQKNSVSVSASISFQKKAAGP